MRASLLETIAMRRWLDGHGGYLRVRTAPPLSSNKLSDYDSYHPSVQSFLRVTGELRLICATSAEVDGGVENDAGERRSVHPEDVEIHIVLPPFARADDKPRGKSRDAYGALWVPLDATPDGNGFFLEPKRGAVVFHSAGMGALTLVARSLEHWLLKWLSVRSIEEFVPKARMCGGNLGEMRSVLDDRAQKATAHIPDDWEFLNFESARSGTGFIMDERDLKKVPGMLAWVRPPKRRGLLHRLFG